MDFKEKSLIGLTEVINNKKNKLSRKSLEFLAAHREEIRLQKTRKKLLPTLAELAAFIGIGGGGDSG